MNKYLLIVSLSIFNSILYAGYDCTKLEYPSEDIQAGNVANIVCHVIDEAYPELHLNKIKIVAIEDSKLFSKFSKGRLSFISFFNLKHLLPFSKGGYVIGYSRKKIFESMNPPSDLMVESVIAHELAHTYKWKKLGGLGSVAFGIYTSVGSEKTRAKYERSIDIHTLYRSVKYSQNYAQGLSDYRQWNLEQTEEEKREYLKKTYYFKEQILAIETIFQEASSEKLLKKVYRKLKNQAPISIQSMQELLEKTSKKLEKRQS